MTPTPANINKGLWLGLLGIVIFAVTLPMTRLAVGTPDAPQMSGVFIALGRAVVAAALSAVFRLGERLDAVTVGFGLAVIATVFVGKKMPVNTLTLREAT